MQSPTAAPLVTIGVPVLNGELYLDETLAGLAAQSLRDIEIVISDNASVDATRSIAERFAREDPRFVVLPPTARLGVADNWNRTLAAARGTYFMWNAADDIALPDHVAECVAALATHPEAQLAFSRVHIIDSTGSVTGDLDDDDMDFTGAPSSRVREFFSRKAYQTLGYGGVFPTDRIRAVGGLPRLFGGDNVLAIRLAMRGPWVQVQRHLFYERRHEGQTHRLQIGDPMDQIQMFQPERRPRLVLPQWELTAQMYAEIFRAKTSRAEQWRTALAVAVHATLPTWRIHALDLKRAALRLIRGHYGEIAAASGATVAS